MTIQRQRMRVVYGMVVDPATMKRYLAGATIMVDAKDTFWRRRVLDGSIRAEAEMNNETKAEE